MHALTTQAQSGAGPCSVTSAVVSFDFQANSSMSVTIRGTKPKALDLRGLDLFLDVQGDLSPALPFGGAALVSAVLPYKLDNSCTWRTFAEGSTEVATGPLRVGPPFAGRSVGEGALRKLVQAGDCPLVFELLVGPGSRDSNPPLGGPGKDIVCAFATRPSKLLQAASAGPAGCDVALPPPLPTLPRRSPPLCSGTLFLWLRLLLFPVALVALLWSAALVAPGAVAAHNPQVVARYLASRGSITGTLPVHSLTLTQAFQLGVISEQYRVLLETVDPAGVKVEAGPSPAAPHTRLLQQAGDLLGRPQGLTHPQLLSIPASITALQDHKSPLARLLGFFTFVNIVWTFAVLGIAVSLGPVLVLALAPLLRLLGGALRRMLVRVLVPLVLKCHQVGLFEAALYAVVAAVIVDGLALPRDWGHFITLTGVGLLVPLTGYTMFLNGPALLTRVRPESWQLMGSLYVVALLTPLACRLESALLAWLAVLALYSIVGFSAGAGRLCYWFGFKSDAARERSVVASTLFTALSVVGHTQGLFDSGNVVGHVHSNDLLAPLALPTALAPFRGPLTLFGAVVLLLGLLISSSSYYGTNFLWEQVRFVVVDCACLYTGLVLGLPGLANTAILFAVLYGMERYRDLHMTNDWNLWVLFLMGSLVLWRGSLWLHTHPEFVVSCFNYKLV